MMEQKGRLGLLGESFLYLYTGDSAAVTRCNITLTDKTDPQVLLDALKAVLCRYDIFRMKPFLDENGNLLLEENREAPAVYAFDEKRAMLGTEESAGYLFRVLYTDDGIITEIFHGLTDARGAWQFTQALLYEYLTRCHGPMTRDENLITSSSPRIESEDELLFERVLADLSGKEEDDENSPDPGPAAPVLSPDKETSAGSKTTRFMLSYSVQDALSITRSLHVTVTSFFLCVFSEALYRMKDAGENGSVIVEMPVDMRPMLKSRSLTNFSSNILVPFERELLERPLEERSGHVRDVMRSLINEDHLYAEIGPYAAALRELVKLPLDEATLHALREKAGEAGALRSSFMLSNVGVLSLSDDMCAHIRDIDFESESLKDNPEIILYSRGDDGRIMMLWKNGDPSFMDMIRKILEEYGLMTEVMPEKECREDYVMPWKFERKPV